LEDTSSSIAPSFDAPRPPKPRYSVRVGVTGDRPDQLQQDATRLELAILANDDNGAADALGDALTNAREKWELETTARNLRLIAEARAARGTGASGIDPVLAELTKRIGTF